MLVTGHQPNYLPYLGFFHKIAKADAFVVVDNVQFVKRGPFGWIHRNRILSDKGPVWLSVPVFTSGKFTQNIDEVRIDNSKPWRKKHLRTIEWNYRTCPYFGSCIGIFREAYSREWDSLAELNEHFIREFLKYLGIKVRIERSSALGASGKASGLIIDFCAKLGADSYLSGVHGKDYLDRAAFDKAGLRLEFQEFSHPVYPQAFGPKFSPYLSIADLIFNCGTDSLRTIMGGGGAIVEPAPSDEGFEEDSQ